MPKKPLRRAPWESETVVAAKNIYVLGEKIVREGDEVFVSQANASAEYVLAHASTGEPTGVSYHTFPSRAKALAFLKEIVQGATWRSNGSKKLTKWLRANLLTKITWDNLAPWLRDEVGTDTKDCTAYSMPCPSTGEIDANTYYSGDRWHVVYCSGSGRGGATFVGSGSSDITFWTDANTAEEILPLWFAENDA